MKMFRQRTATFDDARLIKPTVHTMYSKIGDKHNTDTEGACETTA